MISEGILFWVLLDMVLKAILLGMALLWNSLEVIVLGRYCYSSTRNGTGIEGGSLQNGTRNGTGGDSLQKWYLKWY
jgi:hypothetical protein